MITQLSFKAPSVKLNRLENLWFQLSNSTCNLSCKHCYLSCNANEKNKQFLGLDKVKKALEDAKEHEIQEIYLNGGEPLQHPDINTIIRLCLNKFNVTLITNGILINEKKARFLRQIDQERENDLLFRVSIDHYDEEKNDSIRGRGVYKKAVNAIQNLYRYGFVPIISVVNLWEESDAELKQGFIRLFSSLDMEFDESDIKVIPPIKLGEYAKNFEIYNDNEIVSSEDLAMCDMKKFDCYNSRVITAQGVYVCPLLINDPRGKIGNNLKDFSKEFYLELGSCYTCTQHKDNLLNNSY